LDFEARAVVVTEAGNQEQTDVLKACSMLPPALAKWEYLLQVPKILLERALMWIPIQ
jgi:hypothetical protein